MRNRECFGSPGTEGCVKNRHMGKNMGKNIERQVGAKLNATGVESLAKGYELHSVDRGAIFFFPCSKLGHDENRMVLQ